MKIATRSNQWLLRLLVTGDLLAFVVWITVGLLNHGQTESLLANLIRIAAPFLIAWFVITPFVGSYDLALLQRPAAFIGRSVLAWVLAVSLGLVLRATVFGEGFAPTFAAVTFAVTAVLLLGWRMIVIAVWRESA